MNSFFVKHRVWIVAVLSSIILVYIYSKYVKLAFKEQVVFTQKNTVTERGSIVDRNGKPLAVQANFYHFGVTPKMIKDVDSFAEGVSPFINMSSSEIAARIRSSSSSSFVYIKKKLSQSQYDELNKYIIKEGYTNVARFDRIPGRIYPENDLASQLIGYMGDDAKGLSGIEYSKQQVLSPAENETSGKNIYLTIDANLQYKLEKLAKEALETTQAESLMLIAAEAKTGEILSYISLPSTDLNEYGQSSSDQKMDRPAIEAYEPGSVFKIFSTATFLDTGAITEDSQFLCDGIYEKTTNRGEKIKITCLDHHGWQTVREALKYSCNDALSQMSDEIDTDTFLEYIHKFGFGEKTGVELPAETKGTVKNQNDKYWSARSKATISIGQEISVSALQMVQAATAIANNGTPVKLTFIKRITDSYGIDDYIHNTTLGDNVLKPETAQYILSCMETTAQSGTGSRASLGDISIGVKTGTAQMADPINGGYSETDFLSNCLAIFPVENPEIILYIVIEKAKGETYAGRIVAPVIGKAADEIIDHLGMNRAGAASLEHSGRILINENKPLDLKDTVPDFIGRPKRDLLPLLDGDKIKFKIIGEGWVVDQNPPPGTTITENMTIELYME